MNLAKNGFDSVSMISHFESIISLSFHTISLERITFKKFAKFKIRPSVVLNLMVSLFCCPVACGGRKRGNRQTNKR